MKNMNALSIVFSTAIIIACTPSNASNSNNNNELPPLSSPNFYAFNLPADQEKDFINAVLTAAYPKASKSIEDKKKLISSMGRLAPLHIANYMTGGFLTPVVLYKEYRRFDIKRSVKRIESWRHQKLMDDYQAPEGLIGSHVVRIPLNKSFYYRGESGHNVISHFLRGQVDILDAYEELGTHKEYWANAPRMVSLGHMTKVAFAKLLFSTRYTISPRSKSEAAEKVVDEAMDSVLRIIYAMYNKQDDCPDMNSVMVSGYPQGYTIRPQKDLDEYFSKIAADKTRAYSYVRILNNMYTPIECGYARDVVSSFMGSTAMFNLESTINPDSTVPASKSVMDSIRRFNRAVMTNFLYYYPSTKAILSVYKREEQVGGDNVFIRSIRYDDVPSALDEVADSKPDAHIFTSPAICRAAVHGAESKLGMLRDLSEYCPTKVHAPKIDGLKDTLMMACANEDMQLAEQTIKLLRTVVDEFEQEIYKNSGGKDLRAIAQNLG